MPYRCYGVKRHNREQGVRRREGVVLRARPASFVFKLAGATQPMTAIAEAKGPLPQSGYVPAELSDFGGLNFGEALSAVRTGSYMRCGTTPSTFTSLPIRAAIYERFVYADRGHHQTQKPLAATPA